MAAQLSKETIIERDLLRQIAECRRDDARSLARAGRYAAAVYLGGYAVECALKVSICKILDLEALPRTFAVHDLDVLLMHSGLKRRLSQEQGVAQSFRKLAEVWKSGSRYDDPAMITQSEMEGFLAWVDEVLTWLNDRAS